MEKTEKASRAIRLDSEQTFLCRLENTALDQERFRLLSEHSPRIKEFAEQPEVSAA